MPTDLPLGPVQSVTPKGTLLTRAPPELPVAVGGRRDGLRIGATAVDARREPVGRVVDIVGPVARPFVVIQAERGAKLHRVLGKDVYAAQGAARYSHPPRRPDGPGATQRAAGGRADRPSGWKPRGGRR